MTDDPQGRLYEIVLAGEIGDHFELVFDGMRLQRVAGTTVLTGRVRDQAQLHGLIERMSALGLPLLSVNAVPPADDPSPGPPNREEAP
jgi:hypothetical protein